jgi:uroporphyrinogen-III decarboxylase
MIRIFGIRNSAVCGNLDPAVLHVLEAEFLHKTEQINQKQGIYRQ